MTFIYDKITDKMCKKFLDKDTISIVKKYSIFYTKYDYDLVFEKIEEKLNNIFKDYSKFIYLNVFLLNILNDLDNILMDYHINQINYTLNDVYEKNRKYLMKKFKNETLTINILDLYYDKQHLLIEIENYYYDLNYFDLMFDSKKILIKNLKKYLNFNEYDINQFLSYIYDNLFNKYDLNTFFPKYIDNFGVFLNIDNNK